MIIDHFWKIVFLILLIGAGAIYWLKREEEAEAKNTINELAALLVLDPENRGDDREEFESNVYRAVALLHNLIESGAGTRNNLVTEAAAANDFPSGRAQQLRYNMQTLLETCQEVGVFDGMGGRCMARLESGRPPEIPSGPFKGERLVVAYKVPPIYAEEAAYSFCNVLLLPEPARALSDIGITPDTVSSASALRGAGIITGATYERINSAYRSLR